MTHYSRTLAVLASLLSVVVAAFAPAPAAAQDRAKTKEVVVAFAAEPRTLLPDTIVDWTTNNMVEHMYDRLVDRDPKTYKPSPMLATGWKIVNDTTWEFTLRQGVKFHNGEPFNAQSVKATMDYIKDPANKTHYLPRWAQVKEVQIVNDYTVRFITDKPWPGLIDRIAGSDFLPMPPKALKEQGVQALAAKPIGTGAFRFVQWVRDEKLVVERNPDYWQTPAEASRVHGSRVDVRRSHPARRDHDLARCQATEQKLECANLVAGGNNCVPVIALEPELAGIGQLHPLDRGGEGTQLDTGQNGQRGEAFIQGQSLRFLFLCPA